MCLYVSLFIYILCWYACNYSYISVCMSMSVISVYMCVNIGVYEYECVYVCVYLFIHTCCVGMYSIVHMSLCVCV